MGIPSELTLLRQWCVAISYDDKAPRNPRTLYNASVTDPNDWGTYEEAIAAIDSGRAQYLSFVLSATDPYCVIDIDVDHTAQFQPPVHNQIYSRAKDTYMEQSAGGSGTHVFTRFTLPDGHGLKSTREQIELYDRARAIIMPRRYDNNKPIIYVSVVEPILAELSREMFVITFPDLPTADTVETIIGKMRAGANWENVRYAFDIGYRSQTTASEEDFALMEHIAFYCPTNGNLAMEVFKQAACWTEDRNEKKKEDRRKRSYIRRSFEKAYGARQLTIERNRAHQHNMTAKPEIAKPERLNTDIDHKLQRDLMVANNDNAILRPPSEGLFAVLYVCAAYSAHYHFPAGAITSALAHFSVLVAPYFVAPTGLGLNVYTTIVGESGIGKEDPIGVVANSFHQAAMDPNFEMISDYVDSTFGSREALHEGLAKSGAICYWAREIGKEWESAKKGQSNRSNILDFLTGAYSTANKDGVLAGYKVRNQNAAKIGALVRPVVCIIGDTTPSDMKGLPESVFTSGALARFMFFVSEGLPVQVKNDNALSLDMVVGWIRAIFHDMRRRFRTDTGIATQQLQWDSAATKERYERLSLGYRYAEGETTLQRAIHNRQAAHVLKLASLLAVDQFLINKRELVLTTSDLVWAEGVVNYSVSGLTRLINTNAIIVEEAAPTSVREVRLAKVLYSWFRADSKYRLGEKGNNKRSNAYKAYAAFPALVPWSYIHSELTKHGSKTFGTKEVQESVNNYMQSGYLMQSLIDVSGQPITAGDRKRIYAITQEGADYISSINSDE